MRGLPEKRAAGTIYTHAPAADTEAAIDIAADADHTYVVDWIHYSFDKAPAAPKLLYVKIGTLPKFFVEVTAAGPGFLEFPGGMYGFRNEKLEVRLYADNAGASGKLNLKLR